MIRLFKSGVPLALLAVAAGPTMAADMLLKASPPLPPSWTGFHIGLGLGERTSVVDTTTASAIATNFTPTNLLSTSYCNNTFGLCIPGEPLDSAGFRVAPYVGYDWQLGPQWLVGLEGDWAWARGGRTLSGMFVPGGNNNTNLANGYAENTYAVNTTWDASFRARLGLTPVPNVLLYATGGVAWLHVEQVSACGTLVVGLDDCAPSGFSPATITDATTRTGWTVGGGLETIWWDHWIARAEYRYADFGTWSPGDVRTCPAGGAGVCTGTPNATLSTTTAVQLRTHTVTFGLAYKFWNGLP
jgi:outer membrane immunogenic protein